MKKVFISFTLAVIISSCGGNSDKNQAAGTKKETLSDNSQNPDYLKGIELVGKNDCQTCHKINDILTGPSYMEVAQKYADDKSDTIVSHLASKITTGGKGVWGEAYMTPHPAISNEDAEAMVKYILLLKN